MRHLLPRLAILAALCAAWVTVPAGAEPLATAPALAERALGDPHAPVTMIDFSSLTCPHCADFHRETLPKLKEKYIDTGRLRLVFRDFPLDQNALYAAMMARCADPSRYFGFLDVLFGSQTRWGHVSDVKRPLAQMAALGGMPAADFEACLANKALADGLIQSRFDAEKQFQLRSTPTFVFNDGAARIDGAQPLAKFEEVIDRLLAAK